VLSLREIIDRRSDKNNTRARRCDALLLQKIAADEADVTKEAATGVPTKLRGIIFMPLCDNFQNTARQPLGGK
jgi:hypothetical protein